MIFSEKNSKLKNPLQTCPSPIGQSSKRYAFYSKCELPLECLCFCADDFQIVK